MGKITILKSQEPRQRYRFLSEPLIMKGHDVELLDTGNISASIWRMFYHMRTTRKPDLVISLGMGLKDFVFYWALKLLRIRIVYRLGGDPVFDNGEVAISAWSQGRYRSWLKIVINRLAAKYLLKRTAELIVVNQRIKESLEPYLSRSVQTWVVPQFCRGAAYTRIYRTEDPPILLTAANLRYRKKAEGVILIIKQLAEFVQKAETNVKLRIAGRGEHHKDIIEYLEHAKLPSGLIVELLGYVEDMDAMYKEADVFVYHSEHDATPNVLLESKRWGLPVLLNEYKSFRTIVSNESSGLFYSDAKTFCEQLDRLLKDKTLRQRLGEGAAWEHENKFSIEAVAEKLDNALFR